MRSRIGAVLGAVFTLALVGGAAAGASGLPLGPPGMHESRRVTTLAPGLAYTSIVRGETSPDEFYVVDVGFTLDPAQADQTAARLRADGFAANAIAVDAHPPDQPAPGPAGYLARVGHYTTSSDAQAAAAQIRALGFADVNADWTGDDGTSTGGPWHVHVLDVDPRRFRGTVANVLGTGIVPGRETVSSIDARLGALAAINGGYFVIGDGDGTPGDLAGISMVGGDLVSEAVNGRTALLLPHPDGSGARVEALSTSLTATASDGARREVDGRNRKAGLIRACGGMGGDQPTESPLHDITCTDPSELIQFTPAFGSTSDPSSEVEAMLNRRGRVTEVRGPGGPIPRDGGQKADDHATTTPIKHLVVIFQENVSFDHYFGTYPNATNPSGQPPFTAAPGTPSVNGLAGALLTNNPNSANPQRLDRSEPLTCDQGHGYKQEQQAFDSGLMDKFVPFTDVESCAPPDIAKPGLVMDYYDGNTVTGLWNYAQHFALSDNSYDTVFGPSTPGALNLISGQTHGFAQASPAVTANAT